MRVAIDDPRAPDVLALLAEHIEDMYATSPAESVHALDADALSAASITFFTARDDDGALLGCGALKVLDETAGELKSMRTTASARGRGVASALLEAVVALCRERGIRQLHLETGVEPYFEAARGLYAKHGFTVRGPFADYWDDPNSVFMTRAID